MPRLLQKREILCRFQRKAQSLKFKYHKNLRIKHLIKSVKKPIEIRRRLISLRPKEIRADGSNEIIEVLKGKIVRFKT